VRSPLHDWARSARDVPIAGVGRGGRMVTVKSTCNRATYPRDRAGPCLPADSSQVSVMQAARSVRAKDFDLYRTEGCAASTADCDASADIQPGGWPLPYHWDMAISDEKYAASTSCDLLLKSVVQLPMTGPDLTEYKLQTFNIHALDVVLPRGVKQHDRRAQKRASVTRWPATGALGRGMQRDQVLHVLNQGVIGLRVPGRTPSPGRCRPRSPGRPLL
jgi:hypothetical protein